MGSKDNKKTGVAALRELFYEIKRKQKPSPALEEAVKEKKPASERSEIEQDKKKIASRKPRTDLDL